VLTSSARGRTPSYSRAHEAPLGSILGLWHQLRSQARVGRTRLLHRRERIVVRMVRTAAGRPARVVEVKLRPQIRGTDLKVLGFTTSVPRSRAAVPCLPAGRVFSLQATRLVSSTRRDRRWARQQQHVEPRTPTTRPGSYGSGAPQPGWSRALLDIYLSHNERHQSDCSHYICSSRPLSGSAPAWVKAPRCPTHRLRGR
jgi:hypothetical protein